MQRISVLGGAALSLMLAVTSVPALAASPQAAPVIEQTAIQKVGDRGWDGGWRHKRRHDDDIRFGFSFGAPVFGHPSYAYRACPYGYWFDGYGCVRTHTRYHSYPHHYGVSPGFSVRLGF